MLGEAVIVTTSRRPIITTIDNIGVLQGESAAFGFNGEVAEGDILSTGPGTTVSPLRTTGSGFQVTISADPTAAPGQRTFSVLAPEPVRHLPARSE